MDGLGWVMAPGNNTLDVDECHVELNYIQCLCMWMSTIEVKERVR